MKRATASLALAALLAGCMASPVPRAQAPMRSQAAGFAAFPEGGKCLASLGQRRADFTPLPDRYYGAGCSTVGAVQLAGLQGDSAVFAVRGLGPVTCPLAETLAGWARFGVDRAARQMLGSPLVRIETMGSYACRNVIGAAHGAARLSAHATANAVDVAGFDLADGRRIMVTAGWNDADPAVRAFLRTVRASACKRFTTVLSPDYNAAHHDHLHVEVGSSRFCR